jgi:hypothetical protein
LPAFLKKPVKPFNEQLYLLLDGIKQTCILPQQTGGTCTLLAGSPLRGPRKR